MRDAQGNFSLLIDTCNDHKVAFHHTTIDAMQSLGLGDKLAALYLKVLGGSLCALQGQFREASAVMVGLSQQLFFLPKAAAL